MSGIDGKSAMLAANTFLTPGGKPPAGWPSASDEAGVGGVDLGGGLHAEGEVAAGSARLAAQPERPGDGALDDQDRLPIEVGGLLAPAAAVGGEATGAAQEGLDAGAPGACPFRSEGFCCRLFADGHGAHVMRRMDGGLGGAEAAGYGSVHGADLAVGPHGAHDSEVGAQGPGGGETPSDPDLSSPSGGETPAGSDPSSVRDEVMRAQGKARASCSFCRKTRREVRALITSGFATICNECVGLSVEMLARDKADGVALPGTQVVWVFPWSPNLTPEEIGSFNAGATAIRRAVQGLVCKQCGAPSASGLCGPCVLLGPPAAPSLPVCDRCGMIHVVSDLDALRCYIADLLAPLPKSHPFAGTPVEDAGRADVRAMLASLLDAFICGHCDKAAHVDRGSSDDMPEACDDCWNAARASRVAHQAALAASPADTWTRILTPEGAAMLRGPRPEGPAPWPEIGWRTLAGLECLFLELHAALLCGSTAFKLFEAVHDELAAALCEAPSRDAEIARLQKMLAAERAERTAERDRIARLTAERDTARGEAQATRERLVLTDAKLRRLEEACKLALELLDAALDEDFDDDAKIRAMSRFQTQDARNLLACALGGS